MTDTGWTLSTIEKHLSGEIKSLRVDMDRRFLASEQAVAAALAAADKGVQVALTAAEKSGEKQERSADARHVDLVQRLNTTASTLTEKIEALAIRFERTEGQSSGREQYWGYILGVIGVVGAVVGMLVGLR